MANKPDVILVSTDQQRGDCIGADRRSVRTPALDRLGARGARFANAITPHPMCQPARASILTGRLPYSHGVRDNGRNLDERFGADGLGGMFAKAGYRTHFIGKAHFATQETFHPTGRAECNRCTADFPADWSGPYFGFETGATAEFCDALFFLPTSAAFKCSLYKDAGYPSSLMEKACLLYDRGFIQSFTQGADDLN